MHLPSDAHRAIAKDGAAETAFPINEAHEPSGREESFLLVFRTLRIVTAVHAIDVAALRAPLMPQPVVAGIEPYLREEIARLERQAKRVAVETNEFLTSMHLGGKVVIEKGKPGPAVLK